MYDVALAPQIASVLRYHRELDGDLDAGRNMMSGAPHLPETARPETFLQYVLMNA
jgi:hypothetical protein